MAVDYGRHVASTDAGAWPPFATREVLSIAGLTAVVHLCAAAVGRAVGATANPGRVVMRPVTRRQMFDCLEPTAVM